MLARLPAHARAWVVWVRKPIEAGLTGEITGLTRQDGRRFLQDQADATVILDWQFAHMTRVDRNAVTIRVGELEVMVTKEDLRGYFTGSDSIF